MPDLIASKAFRHDGRWLQVGDAFNARSRQAARVLVAIGRARYMTAESAPEVVKQEDPVDDAPILEPASVETEAVAAEATMEGGETSHAAEEAPAELEQKPAAQKTRKAKK